VSGARAELERALGAAYALERELGGGGMSRVFLAREVALGRLVVVKVLPPDLAGAVSIERFQREIQLAASLQQANIVPLLAAGAAGGVPWFTMPYVEGESLRGRLSGGWRPSPAEAVGILRDVARALSYAHARGVVHRDIKPDNVLLSHGAAMVTDFGIAKAVSASRTLGDQATLTQAGTSLGTPAYMAPEQVAGDADVGTAADLYAWGCLAHELLTGAPPFVRESVQKVMAAHLAEAPAPFASRAGVAPALEQLVLRCLAKDPHDRPAGADAVLAALDAVPTPAAGARSGPGLAHGSARRGRLVFGVIALVGVAVIGWLNLRSGAGDRDGAGPATAVDRASVAVLPFAEVGGGQAGAYLGDGIAETLISALGQVPGLDVAARTSAFAFRGQNVDVREIATKLGVSTVLEGSVQRAGEQLRITAHLVRARDGRTLWTETFDRNAKDIFAVQDEVAREVVGALRGRVLAGVTRGALSSTRDPEAYDLYLQARYQAAKRTNSALDAAIVLYRRALERDSTYALAWSGLADAYTLQGMYADTGGRARLADSRQAADRALALAPELPEALTTHAYLLLLQDWNWAASDTAFAHALRAGPGYALAHKWYADLLCILGRMRECRAEYERAWQLDPMSPIVAANLSQDFGETGDTLREKEWIDRALKLDPNQPLALRLVAPKLVLRGDSARFFDGQARMASGTALAGASVDALRAAWKSGGRRAVAQVQVAAFERQRLPFEAARWYLVNDDVDGAFAALERAIAARNVWSPFLKSYLTAAAARQDPRFAAALRRMRMPVEGR
jgi:serine/threonine-protein kinase